MTLRAGPGTAPAEQLKRTPAESMPKILPTVGVAKNASEPIEEDAGSRAGTAPATVSSRPIASTGRPGATWSAPPWTMSFGLAWAMRSGVQ